MDIDCDREDDVDTDRLLLTDIDFSISTVDIDWDSETLFD